MRATPPAPPGAPERPAVIEATGREWKRGQLLGGLVVAVGMLLLLTGSNPATLQAGLGFVVLGSVAVLVATFAAWYHG